MRRAVVPLQKSLCKLLIPSTFNRVWDSNSKTEILPAYCFQRYNVKTSISRKQKRLGNDFYHSDISLAENSLFPDEVTEVHIFSNMKV
jgi:hypothetical protein